MVHDQVKPKFFQIQNCAVRTKWRMNYVDNLQALRARHNITCKDLSLGNPHCTTKIEKWGLQNYYQSSRTH